MATRMAGQRDLNPPTPYDFEFAGSQTKESLKGLDHDLIKKVQRGKAWGDEDRARYDELAASINTKPQNQGQPPKGQDPKYINNRPQNQVPKGQDPQYIFQLPQGADINTKPQNQGKLPKGQDPRYINNRPQNQVPKGQDPQYIFQLPRGADSNNNANVNSTQQTTQFGETEVDESFNAQGGTLSNSGDLTAGGDITLDNSVTNENTMNQFGGDIRNFTYNAPSYSYGGGSSGGGASYPTMNSYKDPALNATPVSAATMAGFYAPSDSPASAARFNALHSELNRGQQEKYSNVGSDVANKYIDAARRSKTIDTRAMNANLAVQPYVNFAQSDMITAQTFGDIWGANKPNWTMPEPFTRPEQPDFGEMYDDIADDIRG